MSTAGKVGRDNSSSPSKNNKLDETNHEHTLCYICGGNGANWSMFTKANENEKSPYFPFLESMEKAEGAKPVKANGRLDACTVCFSFLLQQWHSYEENGTAVEKRTYWLKRTGAGGINYRVEHDFEVEHSERDLEYLERKQEISESENFNNVELVEKREQNSPESCGYDKEQSIIKERQENQDDTPVLNMRTRNSGSEDLKVEEKIHETVRTCLICGCRKVQDVMKTVHTKPQLKTETPFYPFLHHSELKSNSHSELKQTKFSGKVTVCQPCNMVLLKQWQDFQRKGTPLSERHYHLSPSTPEQKLCSLPTIVCFTCGEKHQEEDCWDVYSKKGKPGDVYFPFLSTLIPAAGAASHTKEGLVRLCTTCYKSLLCQWDDFENQGRSENERTYSVSKKSQRLHENKPHPSLDDTCSVCKVSYPVFKMEYINRSHGQQPEQVPVCCHCKKVVVENDNEIENQSGIQPSCDNSPILNSLNSSDGTQPSCDNRPILSSLNSSDGTQPSCDNRPILSSLNSSDGTQPSCDNRPILSSLNSNDGTQPSCDNRPILNSLNSSDVMSRNKNTANIYKENEDMEVCFLCGENVINSKSLYVLPRHDTSGYKPFFPSLAYMVPAYHAQPLAHSGSVVVCCYCYGNMMNQWYEFEKQDKNGLSNPWSRQYAVKQLTCYLCGEIHSRQKITSISAVDYPFLNQLRRPTTKAFKVDEDYVVCHHCEEIVTVQKENFDKCQVGVHEREFELPMVATDSKCLSKPLKKKLLNSELSSGRTVVLIRDSESEGDDQEQPSKVEQPGNISHDFNLSKLLTGSGNKSPQLEVKEVQSSPMISPGSQNSSFAAALRKLAKQAMSPGSQSPGTIPASSNPNLSPVKNKGCESPKLNGVQNIFKKEVVDSSYLSSKENRGHLNLPTTSDHIVMTTNMGHQVVPGVYSVGARGYENKSNPLEELHGQSHIQDVPRVRAVHPQPPFYMPFLQRPVMNDSMYMAPFHYYPPAMVEPPGLIPPGFDHETWRKRRAMEHLRQQHERHTHFFPPHDHPLYIMDQEKPLLSQTGLPQRSFVSDLTQGREKNLGKNSPRHVSATMPDPRTTNHSTAKETEKNMEVVCSRVASSCNEHTSSASPCSRQSHHSPTTTAIVTSVISAVPQTMCSSKDSAPGEREGEIEGTKDIKQREHQITWTRKMFEQKRRLRQEEIEWQHRQQQMKQQKREVQQELHQFRQKLLQLKESEIDDSSKEHEKLSDNDNNDKNWSTSNENIKEKNIERQDVDKITFPHFGYPVYHDQPVPPQTMHIANIYRTPGLQQHEMFYPPGYPNQVPLPPRMDTRMYREYLQQPPHLLDNKAVGEWLEKQRQTGLEFTAESCPAESTRNNVERSGRTSLILNDKLCNDGENCGHEKLKFMKDLGLMTVSEKKERVQTLAFGSGKRKLDDNVRKLEDALESNKENCVGNGERTTHVAKLAKKGMNVEEEKEGEGYCKKVEFLYNLGLVTHRKRKELEDEFEKNRWERKAQRLQKKTKRIKKEKKEEKERNRSKTPLEMGVSGPITRQKQQLLQEYGLILPIKDSRDKDSSSPDSTTSSDRKGKGNQEQAKKPKKNNDESSIKNDCEKTFHNTYDVSTPPLRPSPCSKTTTTGPKLTLQSITHMENPYTAFRPQFYNSGLLSVRPDTSTKDDQTLQNKTSFLPTKHSKETNIVYESLNRGENVDPDVPTTMGMYDSRQNCEMRQSWLPTDDSYKWPGIKKIMQSYSMFHQEQEGELNFSKAKSENLKMNNTSLNEKSSRLDSSYSRLIHAKRKIEEEQHSLTGKLEKLHKFVVFVQNS